MRTINKQTIKIAMTGWVILMSLVPAISFGADANLNMVFTTTRAGTGGYNAYVHVVWITDSAGNFVYTSGSTTTDNKRAVWANSRASSLTRWWGANPTNRSADVAARTAATQSTYKEYNLNWNWRRKDGTQLPDGNYQIRFECTNYDSGSPSNYATFSITKGASAWRIPAAGSTTTGGYNNVVLTYTPATPTAPAVTTSAATNVTFNSATLNGNLTDNGNQSTTVKIYWGDNDGGTTIGSWDSVIDLGVKSVGAFSSNVINLASAKTYYYRCQASNATGTSWASNTASFTTLSPLSADIHLIPELVFPSTAVGGQSTLTLDIENRGQMPLQVSSISLIGIDTDVFSLVSPPAVPFSLPAGTAPNYPKQTITVRFAPTGPQDYALAQVAVASDDKDEPAVYSRLRGSAATNPLVELKSVGGIGADAKTAAIYGADKVVLGQGAMLSVVDVSNPASPALLYSISAGGMIEDIEVVGDTAYVAAGASGIVAVNLQGPDPLKPDTVYETGGYTHSLSVEGSDIAVADGPAGVKLLTITPSTLEVKKAYTTEGPAIAVKLKNSLLYVLDEEKGLLVINPADPTSTGTESAATTGVAAWWKLDETSGTTAFDTSGNNRNGTLTNGPVWIAGKYGNGLQFDGANDYVQMTGYKGITGTASRTCCAWIKTTGSASNMVILDWGANVSGQQWLFGIFSTGKLAIYAGSPYIQTNALVTDGQWHHVAAVMTDDGSPSINEINLYIDGVLQAVSYSGTTAINTISGPDVMLGTYEYNGQKSNLFPGLIDDIRIYDRALSISEIQAVRDNLVGTKLYQLELGRSLTMNAADAYITDQFGRLFIVNTALTAPLLRGQTMLAGGMASATALSGNYAYAACKAGLEVVDITNPASPVSGGLFAAGAQGSDVVLSGGMLYLAQTTAGLTILDTVLPAAPAIVSAYKLDSTGGSTVSEPSLATTLSSDAGGLKLFDAAKPYLPSQTGQLAGIGAIQDADIVGTMAYLACGADGVKAVDISNAAVPAAGGIFATGGFADCIAAAANLLAVGTGSSVYLINPMTMQEIAQYTAEGRVLGVAISGTYVLVADGQAGLKILNASDGQLAGSLAVDATVYAVDTAVNYAYLACGEKGIKIIDISNAASLTIAGSVDTPSLAMDVAVVGTRVCVADNSSGLTIFDTANPTSPTLYGRFSLPLPAMRVSSADSRLLLSSIRGGFAVVGAKTISGELYSDLSPDNIVNTNDFLVLAGQWMNQETQLDVLAGNLNYFDTEINMGDFKILAVSWLMQRQITLPGFQEVNGMIVFEAEHYDSLRPSQDGGNISWGLRNDTANYLEGPTSNGEYVYVGTNPISANYGNFGQNVLDNAPRADYIINAVTGGTYYIWVRGNLNPGNSVFVVADFNLTAAAPQGAGNWVWWNDDQFLTPAAQITLTPGVHTISIYQREANCGIDKIILTRDSGYVPTAFGPAESPR